MKKIFLLSAIFLFAMLVFESNAADKKVPSVKLKDLKGNTVDSKSFNNDGKPYVINFWATWCKPCIQELNAISDVYAQWQKETGVKIIAVSIDDTRNSKRVAPFVKGRGWEYEIYLDENSDFKRALNVNNPPQTYLVDGKGNIVWEHNGYSPGSEDELYKELKKLVKK